MTPAAVAVAGGPPSTAVDLARAGHEVTLVTLAGPSDGEAAACRAAGVELAAAPPLDVRVTARWLDDGYRLYRAVADGSYDVVVFDGDAADSYSAGRARETASALEGTALVVRLETPALRSLRTRPSIGHHELGAAVTERLAVALADVLVCSRETASWLRDDAWTLPRHVLEDSSPAAAVRAALASRTAPTPGGRVDEPLVSVVVPVYDRTEFLPVCLETLARQDYRRMEVVLADDGSTAPEATRFLSELERRTWPWPLRVARLPHGGLASARNGGWRAAGGDLILFLDDDDAAFDDLVTRTVRASVAAGADVVVAAARTFDGDGRPEPRPGDRVTISLCDPGELTLLGNHSGGPTCLWSRSWLERLGGFSSTPRVVEDWHILVRASLAGARITTPPDPAWWYRRRSTSMFASDPYGALDAALPVMAGLVAETLPARASLLPHLVAAAYRDLERRPQHLDSPPASPLVQARRAVRRAAARLRG